MSLKPRDYIYVQTCAQCVYEGLPEDKEEFDTNSSTENSNDSDSESESTECCYVDFGFKTRELYNIYIDTMCDLGTLFNEGLDKQGYKDWFVDDTIDIVSDLKYDQVCDNPVLIEEIIKW